MSAKEQNNGRLESLKGMKDGLWKTHLSTAKLAALFNDAEFPHSLFYKLYLIETVHYTSHNAKNQALVACRLDNRDIKYQKFCLHHAEEEVGHDLMAWHDLKSIGFTGDKEELPRPLMATEYLISYLYWVSANGNPLQRLGYSFWAEDSYQFMQPMLEKVQSTLMLKNSNLTFFKAHSDLDSHHIGEVEDAMLKSAHTDADWEDIRFVMEATLALCFQMVDQLIAQCRLIKNNEPSHYDTILQKGLL